MELLKLKVEAMDPVEAGQILSCGEEETEYVERNMILTRMHFDPVFEKQVVANFNPPY
jgi:hypothetical protein